MRPTPDPVAAGQESAWSYPRPPRLERATAHLVVVLDGVTIAETNDAWRVLETSHPPNYYFPPGDVLAGAVEPASGASFCEFKGRASYWTVRAGDREVAERRVVVQVAEPELRTRCATTTRSTPGRWTPATSTASSWCRSRAGSTVVGSRRGSRDRSRASPVPGAGEEAAVATIDVRRAGDASTPSWTGSIPGTASASRTTTTRRTRITVCSWSTTTTSSRPATASGPTRTRTWRSSRGCSKVRSSTRQRRQPRGDPPGLAQRMSAGRASGTRSRTRARPSRCTSCRCGSSPMSRASRPSTRRST